MLPPPPTSTLFPYTTLFRSSRQAVELVVRGGQGDFDRAREEQREGTDKQMSPSRSIFSLTTAAGRSDRKSTRLNSSHSQISYAVFCLKKKINKRLHVRITPTNPHTHRTSDDCIFFYNATATTDIYTLSLHDALPIFTTSCRACRPRWAR